MLMLRLSDPELDPGSYLCATVLADAWLGMKIGYLKTIKII